MKKLSTIGEVKAYFEGVIKTTEKTQLQFKTAYRTVEVGKGETKQLRIPYPILIPSIDVTAGEYLEDVNNLGYDSKAILRNGIVLTFIKEFVPAGLQPTKGTKAKNPPADYIDSYLGKLTPEAFNEQKTNIMFFVRQAWAKEKSSGVLPEFVYVDDVLAKEMDEFADALLKR